MNSLDEKKPLIEWEKEIDGWLVDLLPNQHFVEYTKRDAFRRFNIGNVKRNWGYTENAIYQKYIDNKNKYLNNDNALQFNIVDGRKKRLIEWEKQLGFCITNLPNINHLEECSCDEAVKLLYSNYFVRAWDNEADKLYFDCIQFKHNVNYSNILAIRAMDSVKTKIDQNILKPKSSFFNKILDINFGSKFDSKVIKLKKSNSKIGVRKNKLKILLSATLSLVTAVTSYGFSKVNKTVDVAYEDFSYSNNVNKKDLDNVLCLKSSDSFQEYIDSFSVNKKRSEEIIMAQEHYSFEKPLSINEDNLNNDINDLNIGDTINIKDNCFVYDNVYSAIEKNNGYDTYYSYDTDRYISNVALNYHDNIIYSSDMKEIDRYKALGAEVVSVCTDDGFYNSEDIVVKVKKR